ncbi:MAG: hypothetical protein OHK93_006310 [Ramalina farinacea]|uniref:DUF3824 domain-containing protein n=1 Tax=Ramalina farinacea TaxID=258253 RepID=A0AA43QIC0_9LECA|nr:hypothetical protein [Ramalina farinacea]
MSGLLNKAKNALQSEKNTPEAAAANRGNNEYGHDTHATGHSHGGSTLPTGLEGEHKGSQLPGIERGEHYGGTEASNLGPATGSGSATDSVAHSSHISPTNAGVLHSTKPGIHGARDSGTATSLASSGDDSRLTGTTWGTHAGKGHDESVVTSSHTSPTNPGVLDSTKPGIHGLRDSGTAHPTTTGTTGTTGTSGLTGNTGTSGTTYPPTATGHETGGLSSTEKGLAGAGAGAGAVGVAEHEKHKHEHGHHSKDKDVTPVAAKHEHDHHKDSTASQGEKKQGFLSGLLHREKKPSHDETATHTTTTKDTPTHGGSSGLTSSTQPTTTGQTGAGLAGTGSGYEGNNRDRGIVDGGAVAGTGLAGAGVGAAAAHHHHNKEAEKDRLGGTTGPTGGIPSDTRGSDYNQTGSGLTGTSSSAPYESSNRQPGSGLTGASTTGTGAGLGATGSGLGSNTTGQHGYGGSTTAGPHDSNLANKADPRVDSDLDGSSRGLGSSTTTGTGSGLTGGSSSHPHGSGLTGSNTTGGLTSAEKAERYIEGSEQHHRGDGHPEDILHPGHHLTETAKQLDPHMG